MNVARLIQAVDLATQVRGAVATVRWFGRGAAWLWQHLRPSPPRIDRGYVMVVVSSASDDDGHRRGGSRRDRHGRAEPAPRVPVQEVD